MKKIMLVSCLTLAIIGSITLFTPHVSARVDLTDVQKSSCAGSGGSTITGRIDALKAKTDKSDDEKKELQELQDKYPSGSNQCYKASGSLQNIIKNVVNILLFIVGAAAVIMFVVGGLRYVTSNGDQQAITSAKNTIIYSIIGVVIAFLAYAAVNFVTSQLEEGAREIVDCKGKDIAEITAVRAANQKCKEYSDKEKDEIECKDLKPEELEIIKLGKYQKCK
jgi:magnesium-transporting ATPase (P-type)